MWHFQRRVVLGDKQRSQKRDKLFVRDASKWIIVDDKLATSPTERGEIKSKLPSPRASSAESDKRTCVEDTCIRHTGTFLDLTVPCAHAFGSGSCARPHASCELPKIASSWHLFACS